MNLNAIDIAVPGICGMGLSFRLDGFRLIFLFLSVFLWTMATLLSVEYMSHEENRGRYYIFLMLTAVATIGVFLSADLYTTFIFFEVMSFTSYVWVAQNETREALEAALTYLAIAVIGGLILLMGLFLLYHTLGTLRIDELYDAAAAAEPGQRKLLWTAGILILLGFGAKAAMFPLHVWMPRAHTVAPAPASALLSGILTKAGLYGILAISATMFFGNSGWGLLVLLLGMITMTLGAVLAVFAVNLKRTLACSSMSQMGFVLVGIGMAALMGEEGTLAVRGSVLHMVNHSLFKLILFLAAGTVFMNLEQLELNDVRGFGRRKPLLKAVFLSGALGIGGIPLFSGYVSKTLLHESIVEYLELLREGEVSGTVLSFFSGNAAAAELFFRFAELLFLFCGGLTVAYMIKLYAALFVNRHPQRQQEFEGMTHYASPLSCAALILSAIAIPFLGCLPGILMDGIADLSAGFFRTPLPAHAVHYFSLTNLKGGLISIAIGILVYFFFIKKVIMVKEGEGCWRYVDRWPEAIDLEKKVYVPLLSRILPGIGFIVCRFFERLPDFLFMIVKETALQPLQLPTPEEEKERIERHRRLRRRMSVSRWSTMTLSFGFVMSCLGILVLLAWVFMSRWEIR